MTYLPAGLIAVGAVLLVSSFGYRVFSRFYLGAETERRPQGLFQRILFGRVTGVAGVLLWVAGLSPYYLPFQFVSGEKQMTLTGRVAINQSNWAILNPDPGQAVTTSVVLMMKNFPQIGTTQDHIAAAASFFREKSGQRVSISGDLLPFGQIGQSFIFAVIQVGPTGAIQ
jgi:hypothetical protein